MSKSKKNTIDPQIMINRYGADSVRWFILSDSPPDKDIQWSDVGVAAAHKFLQKIWNLNFSLSTKKQNFSETPKIIFSAKNWLYTKIKHFLGLS